MKTYNIKEQIRNYFLENPSSKLRIRQIERKLKLSLPSVIRYVKELENEKIITSQEIAGVKFFLSNTSSINYLIEKKIHNIKLIYSSGLIDYIIEELSSPTIILFGSYSMGEDIESSDIDIYIETPSKKKINLTRFEKILGREIQIFIHKQINEIPNKELINNIINGIKLNGFLEVVK